MSLFSLNPTSEHFFSGGIINTISYEVFNNDVNMWLGECFEILNSIIVGYNTNETEYPYLSKLKESTLTIKPTYNVYFAGSARVRLNDGSLHCELIISRPYYDVIKTSNLINISPIKGMINNIEADYFKVIILHELTHILGFGINIYGITTNTWGSFIKDSSELDIDSSNDISEPFNTSHKYFVGENGLNNFREIMKANMYTLNMEYEYTDPNTGLYYPKYYDYDKIKGIPLENYGTISTQSLHIEGIISQNTNNESNENTIYLDHIQYPYFPRSLMMGIPRIVEITKLEVGILEDLGYTINYDSDEILPNESVNIKPYIENISGAMGDLPIYNIIHVTDKPNDLIITVDNNSIITNNDQYNILYIYQNDNTVYNGEGTESLENNNLIEPGLSHFLVNVEKVDEENLIKYQFLYGFIQYVKGYKNNKLAIAMK